MRALTNTEILDVWERGFAAATPQRALLLLSAACPETAPGKLAAYSIGQRDTCLLELRARMFGDKIISLSLCPQCGENVELEFSTGDFLTPSPSTETERIFGLSEQEYELSFRLPNSLDQARIASSPDLATAQQILLERCVLSATRNGETLSSAALPAPIVSRLTETMAECDPLGSIFLAVNCAHCGNCWQVLFDICDFFWRELSYYARRLLHEVHLLASAYGWSEAEILSLSATRRRLYLELSSQ